jgi:DNA gyrase subunit A
METDRPGDAEEQRLWSQRLEVLDAIVAAIDRRDEVHTVIVSSPSAEQARTRLVALLGVSEVGAVAILDLQWRRLAELERTRIVAERDEIRSRLG